MNFLKQEIRLVLGEEAAAGDRWQLAGIAQHQNRCAEGQQVAAERLVNHRTFVDDDQLCFRNRRTAVERKGRRDALVAGFLILDLLLSTRPVDQRMDG